MRALRLLSGLVVVGHATTTAQLAEHVNHKELGIVERPVDCGQMFLGQPINRCPIYGTITLFETLTTTIPASTISQTQTTTFSVTTTLPGATQTSTYLTTSVTTVVTTLPASEVTLTRTLTTTQPTTVISTQPTTIVSTQPTTIVSTQLTTQPAVTQSVTLPGNTITATTTTQGPNDCSGWQYAVFSNSPASSWSGGNTANWGPTRMKRGGTYANLVQFTGVARFVGGFACGEGTQTTVYGRGITFACRQYSIMHRAYLLAPSTGTYTFSASGIDDDLRFWAGPLAVEGFNDTNHDARGAWDFQQSGAGRFSITRALEQGQALPMRLAFGNAGGGSSFTFGITGPSGNVITGTDVNSQNIVQYGCGSQAIPPQFPYAFGNEL